MVRIMCAVVFVNLAFIFLFLFRLVIVLFEFASFSLISFRSVPSFFQLFTLISSRIVFCVCCVWFQLYAIVAADCARICIYIDLRIRIYRYEKLNCKLYIVISRYRKMTLKLSNSKFFSKKNF